MTRSLDSGHHIFFRYGVFHIFKIIVIGFVYTPKYSFSPDCSFKICEKTSKFSKSVHEVNDYADTVSA